MYLQLNFLRTVRHYFSYYILAFGALCCSCSVFPHSPVPPPCPAMLSHFLFFCRDCFHHHPNQAGIWVLYLHDPCQSDPFSPGLEEHSLHLAVLHNVVRSISPGLEQPHPGHAWTRLHWRLAIQGHQPLVLCAFLVSWLPDGVIAHCQGHILFSIQNVSRRLWTPLPQTVLGRQFPSEKNHTLPPQLVQLSGTSSLIKFCMVSHYLKKNPWGIYSLYITL